jgi:hypothetical protein
MGISIATLAAVLLFVAIIVWMKSTLADHQQPFASGESLNREDEIASGCPAEFVAQIFARNDLEYVSGLGSAQLKKFFAQERKAVALYWVQQMSAQIRRIMREHLQASRRSRDLELATEAGILLRYAGLKCLCGVLFFTITLAGPQGLQGLAARAAAWAQRIREAQLGFQAAKETGKIHGA